MSKIPKMRKSSPKKIEKSDEGGKNLEKTGSMSFWEAFIHFLNSSKTKIFFLIVGIIVLLFLTLKYLHWGVILGYIIIAPLALVLDKWLLKKDYVAILELDPDTWSPRLMWATPTYFADLEIKDEPAVLDSEQTQMLEETEDGDIQIALKGVQPTQDGTRLYVCQDYNPDEGYIHFGWLDNTTPYEWIVRRSKFTQLTGFANKMIERFKDEQSGARSMAVKDMEEMVKEWGRYPYESNKGGMMYESDRKDA